MFASLDLGPLARDGDTISCAAHRDQGPLAAVVAAYAATVAVAALPLAPGLWLLALLVRRICRSLKKTASTAERRRVCMTAKQSAQLARSGLRLARPRSISTLRI